MVQGVVGAEAYVGLSLGFDASNYYRLYVRTGNTMACLKEMAGTKTFIGTEHPWDPSQNAYIQIRHDGTNVVCETSSSSTGMFVPFASQAWNTAAVPLGSVRFELKAGTAAATANAGTARFDHFHAERP